MYYRITGSLITVLILSLAVAFLSYVLFYGVLSYDTEYTAYSELKKQRQLGSWLVRLSTTDSHSDILRAVQTNNTGRLAEYQQWGELSDTQMERLREISKDVSGYRAYFDKISKTSRAVLIADTDPLVLAEKLSEPNRIDEFVERVENLDLEPPLGSKAELRTFVNEQYPFFTSITDEIQSGQRAAINHIREATTAKPLHELFASGETSFLSMLKNSGYTIENETYNKLSREAQAQIDMESIAAALDDQRFAPRLAREMNIKKGALNVSAVLRWANSRGKVDWFVEHANGVSLSTDRILELAKSFRRSSQLQKVVGDKIPVKRAGIFSLEQRTLWLILVSFLVCLVGITNTMLMSVTARFSEIATMKCLGAMDSFVMQLFVYEAMSQGLVGSALGVVLGLLLAFLRSTVGYGGLVFEAIHVGDIMLISVISFLTGIIIAALAAMWPSWTASRLAPMEAMRVE